MTWRELKHQNIDPYSEVSSLQFAGTHDGVVFSVLEGKSDVGTVRTDTLERMAQSGLIKFSKFKVLAQKNYEETILSLVNMIEHRDAYTAGHTARVGQYSELIAREMNLEEDQIKILKKAASPTFSTTG